MRFIVSAFLAVGLLLGGCAVTQQSATTVSQTAVSDLKLIADATLPLAGAVGSLAGATPQQIALVGQDVAQLEAAAAAVQPGVATAAAAPNVATVSSALNAIIAEFGKFSPLPANVQSVLTAAKTLLPLVETAVGVAVALAAEPGEMTPVQARAVLAAHAH